MNVVVIYQNSSVFLAALITISKYVPLFAQFIACLNIITLVQEPKKLIKFGFSDVVNELKIGKLKTTDTL